MPMKSVEFTFKIIGCSGQFFSFHLCKARNVESASLSLILKTMYVKMLALCAVHHLQLLCYMFHVKIDFFLSFPIET